MDKIKSQKQLNIQTEDRWDASCIHVDVPSLQKEDYQLPDASRIIGSEDCWNCR